MKHSAIMKNHHCRRKVCVLLLVLFGILAMVASEPMEDGDKNTKKPQNPPQKRPKKNKKNKNKKKNKKKKNNNEFSGKMGRRLEDIRFNKCPPMMTTTTMPPPQDDASSTTTTPEYAAYSLDYPMGVHKMIFPLMPSDYPVSEELATTLYNETRADSAILASDPSLGGEQLHAKNAHARNASHWLEELSDPPLFPGDPGFWEELRAVVEAQIARRSGDDPSLKTTWPKSWFEEPKHPGFHALSNPLTLESIADAVNGEYPVYWQSSFVYHTVYKQGIITRPNVRGTVDFVAKQVRLSYINAWTFEAVASINFMLKWHLGMPRPEEMAWLIATGELTTETDGVPEDLVAMIASMELESPNDFTAYAVGSPMHPSYPAMHSAGSTLSYWLPVVVNITPEQYCEALRIDYAVAYGRTVAGVHYPMDNTAGLEIGRKILKEELPAMLSDRYGYDPTVVRAKLEVLYFGFSGFDPRDCTVDGMAASELLAQAAAIGDLQ